MAHHPGGQSALASPGREGAGGEETRREGAAGWNPLALVRVRRGRGSRKRGLAATPAWAMAYDVYVGRLKRPRAERSEDEQLCTAAPTRLLPSEPGRGEANRDHVRISTGSALHRLSACLPFRPRSSSLERPRRRPATGTRARVVSFPQHPNWLARSLASTLCQAIARDLHPAPWLRCGIHVSELSQA